MPISDDALARWESGQPIAATRQPLHRVPPKPPKPLPPKTSKYLTVNEVADELGVSKMTVYRMAHEGEIKAHRFGRSIRVHRDDLDAYLDESVVR